MKTILPPGSDRSAELASRFHYDEWLVSRFLEYVPHPDEFLEKMEAEPSLYLRVNTLKSSADLLKPRLAEKGFELRDTPLHEVFGFARGWVPAGATLEYMLGHYYIQDLSSCLAVDALDARDGQTVLDVAAAPGGKTTMIAQRMHNTGAIVAAEPSASRTRSLIFNLARCGVSNTCIKSIRGEEASTLGTKFDRVLLDAPCSCEGVIAKDVNRKTSHSPSDVEFCSARQESLIESAAGVVKKGGVLVYSTCSFAPEENEAVVNSLLEKRHDISLEPLDFGSEGLTRFQNIEFGGEMKKTRRLYPHLHDTTGFFVAKMRVG